MRLLKDIIIVILVVFFMIWGTILLINLSLNKTFFSSRYFAGSIYKSDFDLQIASKLIKSIIDTEIENFNVLNVNIKPSLILENEIDLNWSKNQVNSFLTSTFDYIIGRSLYLPTINIAPIKRSIENSIIDEALKGETIKKEINRVINNPEMSSFFGIDERVINELKYSFEINKTIEYSKLQKEILRLIINKDERISQIETFIDVNNYYNKTYKNGENPLWAIKKMLTSYRVITNRVLSIGLLLTIILTLLVVMSFKNFLRIIASGIISSGALVLILGISGSILTKLILFLEHLGFEINVFKILNIINSLVSIIDFLKFIIQDFTVYLTRYSLIAVCIGIVVLLISCIKVSLVITKINYIHDKFKANVSQKTRIIMAFIILFFMILFCGFNFNLLNQDINKSMNILNDANFDIKAIFSKY